MNQDHGSLYRLQLPIPTRFQHEASELEEVQVEDEELGILEESLFLFRLSGPNERLSKNDHFDEELVSSGDSIVLSLRKERRRRFTRKEKEKKKM